MRYSDLTALLLLAALCGCGGSTGTTTDTSITETETPVQTDEIEMEIETEDDTVAVADALDEQLAPLLTAANVTGDAAGNRVLPEISQPLPQLGKLLFFSASLGGEFDTACVSCHHPLLGGADALSLPVGVGASEPLLLGPGRVHALSGLPNVPRNSPTVFNSGLWDGGMFWDSRVESFGKEENANGLVSSIRTPDVALGAVDADAGDSLPVAQARFPVTSDVEMRGDLAPGASNEEVRNHLAGRIGGHGTGAGEIDATQWRQAFADVYGEDSPERLVTFSRIAEALGAYERSMIFTRNPFTDYLEGDLQALTAAQKRGAILFYSEPEDGGGSCHRCHSGNSFSDNEHHTIAFPQIGFGMGDGTEDDFGRGGETGTELDRYRFRTPSLLNVAVTAPYGHAGAYESLDQVLAHYNNSGATVTAFFNGGGVCSLEQFENNSDCGNLYPNARANSEAALVKLAEERASGDSEFENLQLNNNERSDLVAFLQALTDPCVQNADCLAPWIADSEDDGPDGQQINARFNGDVGR